MMRPTPRRRLTPAEGTRVLVAGSPAAAAHRALATDRAPTARAAAELTRHGDVRGILEDLHARLETWSRTADVILREYAEEWGLRDHPGANSEATLRALRYALLVAVRSLAEEIRPADGRQAVVASLPGEDAELRLALSLLVLHEAGLAGVDAGPAVTPAVLGDMVRHHEARACILVAGSERGWALPDAWLDAAASAVTLAGGEMWFLGATPWPVSRGARVCSTYGALGGGLRRP
jgi:hypothetical protein